MTLISLSAGTKAENSRVYHPDGAIGFFSASITAQYLSCTSELPLPTCDRQRLGIDLAFPFNRNLVFKTGYSIEPNDSLYHRAGIGISYYTLAIQTTDSKNNPDGPIGAPVISINARARIQDNDPDDTRLNIAALINMPLTPHLSLGAGMNYYDKDDPLIVDEYFGQLSWFLKTYDTDKAYVNPDGPPGYPVFHIRGGGNDNGLFGQLSIVLPMMPKYSLSLAFLGSRITDLKITEIGITAAINLYSGNI